jgi:hypothetical protein
MKIEIIQHQSQQLPPLPKAQENENQAHEQQAQEVQTSAPVQPNLQTGMNLSFQVKKD